MTPGLIVFGGVGVVCLFVVWYYFQFETEKAKTIERLIKRTQVGLLVWSPYEPMSDSDPKLWGVDELDKRQCRFHSGSHGFLMRFRHLWIHHWEEGYKRYDGKELGAIHISPAIRLWQLWCAAEEQIARHKKYATDAPKKPPPDPLFGLGWGEEPDWKE